MVDKIKQLKNIIDSSKNIVLFTGAGISVPSGIPDFRSDKGLYNAGLTEYGISPEDALSHYFFRYKTEEFFQFYKSNMVYKNAKPNVAHKFFAELETQGKLKAVVTQNIDGLHEMAGNKVVYNLHGSIYKNYCEDCKKAYTLDYILDSQGVPTCDTCGGVVKPNVVLYGEMLDEDVKFCAKEAIKQAETLIVVGTSLVVQPAASYVSLFSGDNLVLINLQETPYDKYANLVINEPVEKVVEAIEVEIMKQKC